VASTTIRTFRIALADADRDVYAALEVRVAQHPSETDRYIVARVIARALEHGDGIELSPGGVSDGDAPALVQRDLRGDIVAWIDVGAPAVERLHKATKLAPRVVVYAWKGADALAAAIDDRGVHRADRIELYELPIDLLDAIAATLDRANGWELSRSGGTLYVAIAGASLVGETRRVR
jgi:uncharacterized protein YaeQ